MKRLLLGLVLLFALLGGQTRAADTQDAAHLEGMIRDGAASGEVFYNLGLARFREGNVGEGLAAMLAARRDMPRDPDVAANIKVMMGRVTDRLDPQMPRPAWGMLVFWVFEATPRELMWVGCLFWAAGFVVLVVARFLKRGFGATVSGGVLAAIGALLLLTVPLAVSQQKPWGAVVTSSVPVKSAPQGQVDLFVLHEGAPFQMTGRDGDWVKIALSDGKQGWVEGKSVKVHEY